MPPTPPHPSIAILTIATGQYFHTFIPPLLPTIQKFFLPSHPRHTFILTDQTNHSALTPQSSPLTPHSSVPTTQHSALSTQSSLLDIPHHPWPLSTLLRFHHFTRHAPAFAHFDYLFYMDADMLVVDTIPPDILSPLGLSAVQHPGYWPRKRATFEHNPKSLAYLPRSFHGPYYQGCFFGGPTHAFLSMSALLRDRIDHDLAQSPPLIAQWHDESHLNWFLAQHPPANSLLPSYAYVDAYNLPVPRKIVHLPKNHEAIRAG